MTEREVEQPEKEPEQPPEVSKTTNQSKEENDWFAEYQSVFSKDGTSLWDTFDISKTLQPLTEQEKSTLRAKLPKAVANFVIRRADAAARLREIKGGDDSVIGQFFSDLPPDVPDWDNPINAEYRDYVYETTSAPPSFQRKGSSLFGGAGDGVSVIDDGSYPNDVISASDGTNHSKRIVSLFVGQVDSIDEQASKVGYGLLALFILLIGAKGIFALISFFVSFTFSFLAIFALSAGIFMVFYLFRF